jgi:hypothetical protein
MSKREHVLRLLREAGPRGVTTDEFLEAGCGSRFGARVQELRDQGWTIDARHVRTGSHLYVLARQPLALCGVSEPEPERLFEPPSASPLNAALHDWEAA